MDNLEDAREEMDRAGIGGMVNPNRWCYSGEDFPFERQISLQWGKGAKGARKMWDYFKTQHRTEAERMVHCQGCKYLQTAGAFLVCGYLLATGERRPCPFGGPCKAKKLLKGYRLPEDYEARIAAAEEKRRRRETEAQTQPKKRGGSRGPQRGWDEEYVIALYRKDFMLTEIAEVVGVSYTTLRKIGIRNGWYHAGHRGIHAHNLDLETEKARYRAYLEQKNSGK